MEVVAARMYPPALGFGREVNTLPCKTAGMRNPWLLLLFLSEQMELQPGQRAVIIIRTYSKFNIPVLLICRSLDLVFYWEEANLNLKHVAPTFSSISSTNPFHFPFSRVPQFPSGGSLNEYLSVYIHYIVIK